MKRTVSVTVSGLAWEAVESVDALDSIEPPVRLESAVRTYIDDKDQGRPGWPYPRFLGESEDGSGRVTVALEIDAGVWEAFEEEAKGQGVGVDELASHASLYLAAEAEAGRLVRRLLAGEEAGGEETA